MQSFLESLFKGLHTPNDSEPQSKHTRMNEVQSSVCMSLLKINMVIPSETQLPLTLTLGVNRLLDIER